MELRDLSNEITTQWCKSINEIDCFDWKGIFGNTSIKSYSFFQAMEQSSFSAVEFHYLLVRKQGAIICIVPCFCYELDLLHLTTSSTIKTLIENMRLLFPKFFKLKTFVTGSYAATCEHFIECHQDLDKKETDILSSKLNQQLKEKYKETQSQILFIKDIRERAIKKLTAILDKELKFFVSFPTTVIPVFKNDLPYPQILKKKSRKRYRVFKEKFNKDFTWEIVIDFRAYVPLLTELYQNVLEKAKNKFEVLNSKFFYNINKNFPKSSYLLIAKDKKGQIRLIEVILEEKNKLLPLYLGIQYKDDDTKVLYLNAIFRTIEEAEIRGKDFVDFGQTSYYPKVLSGAIAENVYYGFWSDKFIIKKMIIHLFKNIFIPPTVLEDVYLGEHKEKAYKHIEEEGFIILNK